MRLRAFSLLRLLSIAGIVLIAALPAAASRSPGVGGAVSIARAQPSFDDAAATALAVVTNGLADLGLAPDDVADVVVSGVVFSAHSGVTNVYLQQRYRGIEVFGAVLNVTIDGEGTVVRIVGEFVAGVAKLAPSTTPGLSDVAAAREAAAALGLLPTSELERRSSVSGPERATEVSDGGISLENIPTRLMLQPIDGGVRLVWEVTIYELDAENWWQVRVDATTGEELDRNNLVSPDSYNVYAAPVEAPSFGARTLEVDPADPVASPFGWHDTDGVAGPEFTVTEGNNVTAYTDTDGDNVMDPGSQPEGGPSLVFDFPLDLALEPSTYRDAAVANLFYANNRLHDVFYAYGFDEAAGNFQTNTYGNGGLGGDAVQAEVQDGAGTNLANFATPIDGFAPRMQMFAWTLTVPGRDVSLDTAVVAHEYGHGVSIRLTGGPNVVTCLQNAEQPGEGWSDYFGLMFTMKPGDIGSTPRGFATYPLGQPTTGPGIRDFRYSTDLVVDPRTYNSIKTASIPHGVGSTFTAMLWDMTWDLIARDGFDADLINGTGGNITALQLVMDGLKLQPCAPGFVDARDAILLADELTNSGTNECLIWRAFAKRGLGASADQGVSASRTDGTEAFDVPPNCANLALVKSATPASVEAGNTVTYSLQVINNTTGTLTGVTVTDPIPVGTSFVPGSPTCGGPLIGGEVTFIVGALGPLASTTCSFDVTVDPGPGTVTLLDDDFESGSAQWAITHGVGTADWATSTGSPHSPVTSMFAADGPALSDQYLSTITPFPVSSNTTLRFWHSYDTENTWDGGVVEVSTDGGVVWLDLGPSFTANGYNGTLNASANPLAGRSAFTGDSSGYVRSAVDLSSFAGSSVLLRFRLGTDNSVAADGWTIDDISLRDEVWVSNTASAVSNEGPPAMASLDTAVTPPLGLLRVTTSPSVPSVISVDGLWTDAFGLDWVQTPAGSYEICFSDVPGFSSPPCTTAVVTGAATTTVDGVFVAHGTLAVTSSPAVATTITVEGAPVNDWGALVSIEPGSYEVCFGAVADFDAPTCETAVVTAGATTGVIGAFVSNPGAPGPTGMGLLRATTSPSVPSQMLIDGTRAVSFGVDWVKLSPGSHEVCYSDVPGFSTPPCETVTIADSITTEVVGVFAALAELRVLTSPPADKVVTVNGRAIDQYGFWTWAPPDIAYDVCAGGYVCQTVTPPPATLTTVTLIP